MRFLIIDDDQDSVQSLRRMLIAEIPGVRSTAACYGIESAKVTLSTFNDNDAVVLPDVVILEANLGEGSSILLIRLIRECRGMKKIPILIYTSSLDDELKRSCLIAGAGKIIQKTSGNHDCLFAAIKALISSR